MSLGATHGSVAAIIAFLIWLSWNVNAMFLGGELATEAAIAMAQTAVVRTCEPES